MTKVNITEKVISDYLTGARYLAWLSAISMGILVLTVYPASMIRPLASDILNIGPMLEELLALLIGIYVAKKYIRLKDALWFSVFVNIFIPSLVIYGLFYEDKTFIAKSLVWTGLLRVLLSILYSEAKNYNEHLMLDSGVVKGIHEELKKIRNIYYIPYPIISAIGYGVATLIYNIIQIDYMSALYYVTIIQIVTTLPMAYINVRYIHV